ncbi:hypothetical protein FHG87_015322 [Trinorchestia longiramus]|nr:hypothetical protein FHG87_015322 [Trinorchestia longiramus]
MGYENIFRVHHGVSNRIQHYHMVPTQPKLGFRGTFHFSQAKMYVWPARSPDLNPLDFSIWFILQTRVLATPHTSLKSLKAKLQKEWEAISQEQIRAACDAFVNRVKPIVRNKGGYFE